jgi:tRNA uridine 5-carboxymethylaminomethyl modification enzyme
MDFDIVVIGGGHAGIEAVHAGARLGCRTALITLSEHTIGQMSCNPAIGGVAKGHLVREIDALGGVMGRLIDGAGIQFRMLNTGKGPAVRAPRAQADKRIYRSEARRLMECAPGISVVKASAEGLVTEEGEIQGLRIRRVLAEDVRDGRSSQPHISFRFSDTTEIIRCRSVVVSTGTFLNGKIYRGMDAKPGGRDGEPGPGGLAASFLEIGLATGRHKTGTPARIKGESRSPARSAWGRPPANVLPLQQRGASSAAGELSPDTDQPTHSRCHPKKHREVSPLCGIDRRSRAEVLPLH